LAGNIKRLTDNRQIVLSGKSKIYTAKSKTE
jgi:hypothetical protein